MNDFIGRMLEQNLESFQKTKENPGLPELNQESEVPEMYDSSNNVNKVQLPYDWEKEQ